MDSTLQWIMTIIAGLVGAGVIGGVKALFGIRDGLAKLNLKFELFAQSAESRFESLEDKAGEVEVRLTVLENRPGK